jgi:hypothetical protein
LGYVRRNRHAAPANDTDPRKMAISKATEGSLFAVGATGDELVAGRGTAPWEAIGAPDGSLTVKKPMAGMRTVPMQSSRYATLDNTVIIHGGSTILGVGPGGSNPLAPTKLTNLALELKDGRECRVEPEVDCVRRELIFEPLEPQDVELGEDRPTRAWRPSGPESAHSRGNGPRH